jgi:hypothetical protein
VYINVHVLDKTESCKSIVKMKKNNIMFYYSDVNCANLYANLKLIYLPIWCNMKIKKKYINILLEVYMEHG